jgi:hypothetical protein
LITLPSSSAPSIASLAATASSTEENSTNPNHLDLPVSLSFMILAKDTSPNSLKASFKSCQSKFQDIPPTNNLLVSIIKNKNIKIVEKNNFILYLVLRFNLDLAQRKK